MNGEQFYGYLTNMMQTVQAASNVDEFEAAWSSVRQNAPLFERELMGALVRTFEGVSDPAVKEALTLLLVLAEWNKVVLMMFVNPVAFAGPEVAAQIRAVEEASDSDEGDEGGEGDEDAGDSGNGEGGVPAPLIEAGPQATDEQRAGLEAAFSKRKKK
jgi:hypothetical protein